MHIISTSTAGPQSGKTKLLKTRKVHHLLIYQFHTQKCFDYEDTHLLVFVLVWHIQHNI